MSPVVLSIAVRQHFGFYGTVGVIVGMLMRTINRTAMQYTEVNGVIMTLEDFINYDHDKNYQHKN